MSINAVRLAFVRHGQSTGSVENIRERAQTATSLTPLGREQAEATAGYLSQFQPELIPMPGALKKKTKR